MVRESSQTIAMDSFESVYSWDSEGAEKMDKVDNGNSVEYNYC